MGKVIVFVFVKKEFGRGAQVNLGNWGLGNSEMNTYPNKYRV